MNRSRRELTQTFVVAALDNIDIFYGEQGPSRPMAIWVGDISEGDEKFIVRGVVLSPSGYDGRLMYEIHVAQTWEEDQNMNAAGMFWFDDNMDTLDLVTKFNEFRQRPVLEMAAIMLVSWIHDNWIDS